MRRNHPIHRLGGLDIRSNPLTRQDGTFRDARNVYLDSSRKLRKIPDMDMTVLPRGTEGETGLFEDKLPFHSRVIDILEWEDTFILAVKVRTSVTRLEFPTGTYIDVSKFYKWDMTLNTVEFIPFDCKTGNSNKEGSFINNTKANFKGAIKAIPLSGKLYMWSSESETDLELSKDSKTHTLNTILSYDGRTISVVGVPDVLKSVSGDEDLVDQEYIRMVPMKLQENGTRIFGNYSTSIGRFTDDSDISKRTNTLDLNEGIFYENDNKGSADKEENSKTDDMTLRESSVLFDLPDEDLAPSISRTFKSFYKTPDYGVPNVAPIAKGQILYFTVLNTDIPRYTFTHVYRAKVETVSNITDASIDLSFTDIKEWRGGDKLWEDNPVLPLKTNSVLSNIIWGVYSSSKRFASYDFKRLTTILNTRDLPNPGVSYPSQGLIYYVAGDNVSDSRPLGDFPISEKFEDIYDEDRPKRPLPMVRDFTDYLGTIVGVTDTQAVLSDISTGGSVESWYSFDVRNIGSEKFGKLTAIFANETFLAAFRETESYYISGNFLTNGYSINSYKSTGVGCTDGKSIAPLEGSGIFVSDRGVYLAMQGRRIEELSEPIAPIFVENKLDLDLDLSNIKSHVDFRREYLMFVSNGKILAYSYYSNVWYIWDYVPTEGGFLVSEEGWISSDGINVFREMNTSKKAESVIKFNFWDAGLPSTTKTFSHLWLSMSDMRTEDSAIEGSTYVNFKEEDSVFEFNVDSVEGNTDLKISNTFTSVRTLAMDITSRPGNIFIIDGVEYMTSGHSKVVINDKQ